MKFVFSKKRLIWFAITALVVVVITLGFVFGLKNASNLVLKGAVVSNGVGCAEIGSDMLVKGGSAVDAAIATLLCEGVILPQSMGIGGGFFATIYTKATRKVKTMNAREVAPLAAHRDMFIDKKILGANASAVPGEILGYWRLHREFGILKWKDLFKPTIALCRNGHIVSKHLAFVLESNHQRIYEEPSLAEIFINPTTDKVWREGDFMKRVKLADTLEVIAEKGADAMYRGGEIGKLFVKDVQEMGGIITEDDLKSYDIRWEEPVIANVTGGYTLYTTPLPSSGALLAFIFNIINPLYTENREVYWQRVIESFKHAYGQRTNLGDLYYEPDSRAVFKNITSDAFANYVRTLIYDNKTFSGYDYYGANFANIDNHGTANMAVLAPNGDAVTITSTVNNYLGAKLRSRRTGIILNDELDDFSTPGLINGFGIPSSPANYIKPGKRPMSSMCPTIILDKDGNVQLLVGAAGGSKITTSVAQGIIRYLIFNETMKSSIQAGRLHHQLVPMSIVYEPEVKENILTYLKNIGHAVESFSENSAFSALTAIGVKDQNPDPVYDRRRLGSIAIVHAKNKMQN